MKVKLRGNFSTEFIQNIPALEKEMVAHSLAPADFTIEKILSPVQAMAVRNPALDVGAFDNFSYEYTVHVLKDAFTVTMPNDMQFLEYFYKLCISPDEGKITAAEKLINIIKRLENWFLEDPLKKNK